MRPTVTMAAHLRTTALVLALCTLSAPVQAERYVPLQNPPELQLVGSRKLTEAEIRPLLLDALDRASSPTLHWTVDSEQPGLMVARFVIRSHSARVDIHYSPASIRVAYKDSVNLGDDRKGSYPLIHRNYHIWVDFLVSKIKYVVARVDSPDKVALREGPAVAGVQSASAQQPAASPVAVTKAGNAYKVGIFPAIGQFIPRPNSPWDERNAAQNFRGQIAANDSLALVYSHYEPGLDHPRLYDASKLWAGQTPKLPVIYAEARARNLDAVFIYRGAGFFVGYPDRVSGPMPIELYLIDAKQQRVYHRKGDTDGLQSMIEQLVSELLQGRRPS